MIQGSRDHHSISPGSDIFQRIDSNFAILVAGLVNAPKLARALSILTSADAAAYEGRDLRHTVRKEGFPVGAVGSWRTYISHTN